MNLTTSSPLWPNSTFLNKLTQPTVHNFLNMLHKNLNKKYNIRDKICCELLTLMGHNISAQLFIAPFLRNVGFQLIVYFNKVKFRALVLKHWWIEVLWAVITTHVIVVVVYDLIHRSALPRILLLLVIIYPILLSQKVALFLVRLRMLYVLLRLPHGLCSDLIKCSQITSSSTNKRVIVASSI